MLSLRDVLLTPCDEAKTELTRHLLIVDLSNIVISFLLLRHTDTPITQEELNTFLRILQDPINNVSLDTELCSRFDFGPPLFEGIRFQSTALIIATQHNLSSVMKALIEENADVNQNVMGQAALQVALKDKNKATTKLLIAYGAKSVDTDNCLARRTSIHDFYKQCKAEQEAAETDNQKSLSNPSFNGQ